MTITNESNLSNNHKLSSQAQPDNIMENKQQQTLEPPETNLAQETETSASAMNEISKTADKSNESKTFFDWTEAILLPLVLALLGAGFTATQWLITIQRENADSIAKAIETREQVLTDYGKTIAQLVTEYNLGENSNESVKNIARGQTLIALRRLDSGDKSKDDTGKLKGLLIRYLYDAQLITYNRVNTDNINKKQVINLDKANINNVVLEEAVLLAIGLRDTELKNGNFKNTYLRDANFSAADLSNADFTNAYLSDADLMRANLSNVDLTNVDLTNANLREANLANAKFTNEIIKKACNWEEAIYVPVTYALDSAVEEGEPRRTKERDIEPNKSKIEEMKQDKASDPKLPVDCSKWDTDW